MAQSTFLLIFLFAILNWSFVNSQCSWTDPNGNFYDFSSLQSATDYSQTGAALTSTYYYNFCGPCNSLHGCNVASQAYVNKAMGSISCGALAISEATYSLYSAGGSSGVTMSFTGDNSCNGLPYQLKMNLICKPSVTIEPVQAGHDSSSPCATFITVNSMFACVGGSSPTNSNSSTGLSGGWVFVIIFLVGSFLYCVGGFGYKMQVQGTVGLESVPNIDFWKDFPSLIMDGFYFTVAKIRGNIYEPLPAEN